MFRLIKVVLNGFVSAPLKIDQPQSRHVESSFIAFCVVSFLVYSEWGIRKLERQEAPVCF